MITAMSAGSSASFEGWGKSVVELEAGTHIDPSQGGPARTSRETGTAADMAALLHFHHTSSPEPPEVTQRSHSSKPIPDHLQTSSRPVSRMLSNLQNAPTHTKVLLVSQDGQDQPWN